MSRARWLAAGVLATLLLGTVYTPMDPYAQAYFESRDSGASWEHWLGVDRLGRDFLSRLWRGAGNSLAFAALASAGALLAAGGLLGVERLGGRAVAAAARSVAALGLAMPAALVGLLAAVFMERGPFALALAVALAGTPFAFRQLRTLWIEQVRAPYVEASRAVGGGWRHLFRFAIWPNFWPQLVELAKVVFAFGLLELSALMYLGLGGDPNWAELGSLLRDGQRQISQDPAAALWPGLLLCLALSCVRIVRVAGYARLAQA